MISIHRMTVGRVALAAWDRPRLLPFPNLKASDGKSLIYNLEVRHERALAELRCG